MLISPKIFIFIWLVLLALCVSTVRLFGASPNAVEYISVVFAALLSLATYLLNYPALSANNQLFLQRLLGSMMAKLMLSVGFVLFFIYSKKLGDIQSFIIIYFISYFLFTAFEVYALLNNLHANKKS